MNKLTVRRLTKLAGYLDSLPPVASKHFRMLHWFKHKGKDDHPFSPSGICKKDLSYCGTSACAAGWAATIPQFKRAGLKVDATGDLTLNGTRGIWSSMELVEQFFGLTTRQTSHLFGPYTKIKTPKEWAKRCRKFLREHAKDIE